MTAKKKSEEIIDYDVKSQIRAAYSKGKKTVTINGREFKIKRLDHTITKIVGGSSSMHYTKRGMTLGGERITFKESWLVVSPTRPPCVPVWNFALKGNQIRSTR